MAGLLKIGLLVMMLGFGEKAENLPSLPSGNSETKIKIQLSEKFPEIKSASVYFRNLLFEIYAGAVDVDKHIMLFQLLAVNGPHLLVDESSYGGSQKQANGKTGIKDEFGEIGPVGYKPIIHLVLNPFFIGLFIGILVITLLDILIKSNPADSTGSMKEGR